MVLVYFVLRINSSNLATLSLLHTSSSPYLMLTIANTCLYLHKLTHSNSESIWWFSAKCETKDSSINMAIWNWSATEWEREREKAKKEMEKLQTTTAATQIHTRARNTFYAMHMNDKIMTKSMQETIIIHL